MILQVSVFHHVARHLIFSTGRTPLEGLLWFIYHVCILESTFGFLKSGYQGDFAHFLHNLIMM